MDVTVNWSKEKTYILCCIKQACLIYARCLFAIWVQRCNLAKSNEKGAKSTVGVRNFHLRRNQI